MRSLPGIEEKSEGPDVMTNARSLKAVVIDDEPVVLSCIRLLLMRRGFEVLTYSSPVDFPVSQLKACPCNMFPDCPDLIISDLDMPAINGADLLEGVIKKGCRCRHVALISGKGMKEADLIRMAKYGTRYFIKPIDLAQFYAWLDRVEHDIAMVHSA